METTLTILSFIASALTIVGSIAAAAVKIVSYFRQIKQLLDDHTAAVTVLTDRVAKLEANQR